MFFSFLKNCETTFSMPFLKKCCHWKIRSYVGNNSFKVIFSEISLLLMYLVLPEFCESYHHSSPVLEIREKRLSGFHNGTWIGKSFHSFSSHPTKGTGGVIDGPIRRPNGKIILDGKGSGKVRKTLTELSLEKSRNLSMQTFALAASENNFKTWKLQVITGEEKKESNNLDILWHWGRI